MLLLSLRYVAELFLILENLLCMQHIKKVYIGRLCWNKALIHVNAE